jgi:DNA repair exonuclease SbcCD ATPase subunit
MDVNVLRKQLMEEIQNQYETKLREAKRQKTEAEEELESAAERWRTERRRLNSEIDRLEAALSEARNPARTKAAGEGRIAGVPAEELAKVQQAAEEKLKSAMEEWQAERERLLAQNSRLEHAVAEAIERSSNPIRSTQAIKDQFEARLDDAAKQRLEVEQELLRVKAAWDEDKKKLMAEVMKLRRLAPSKAFEVKEKIERIHGRIESVEQIRIRELEDQLADARAEATKYHEASVKVQQQLATTTRELQQLQETASSAPEATAGLSAEAIEQLRREYEAKIADLTREKEQLQKQLSNATKEVESLQRALSDTREQVNSEVMQQLRQQYDSKIQDMIQQKTNLAKELEAATSMLQNERARFATEMTHSQPQAEVAADGLESEVKRIEEMIHDIVALIEDPSTELATIIRKNVEKAELNAYLKGILFSMGRANAL